MEIRMALWGGVGGFLPLFFRSETDSINTSNSPTIHIMAVCLRGGLKILTISTNFVWDINSTHDPFKKKLIKKNHTNSVWRILPNLFSLPHQVLFTLTHFLLNQWGCTFIPSWPHFSEPSVLPDSSSDLLSFSESVRVRAEFSRLDTPELRRDFTRPLPAHSWMARSGDSGPSGSESASEPALRE